MPRPQFTLRALLLAMLVVAAFLGGMAVQRALMDHERRSVQQYEKAVRDYREALSDYEERLRNPSGGVIGEFGPLPYDVEIDQKTGLRLPASRVRRLVRAGEDR